jgi:hypothetical protein
VVAPCDVSYDLIWRHGSDDTLASFAHHFDPLTGAEKFYASQFEADANGIAAAASAGDQLVLRFGANSNPDASAGITDVFIPNGDGANAHGRIPSVTLPK